MATAYTSLLGLALPVTGELQGTWGTTVNDSITSLLDTAVAGTTTLSADTDVTLSTTTGAANQARQAILLCSGARTVLRTITAPAQSKIYTVINATTGGFSVKLVGVGPTTGVTIVAGESALVAWNGSDFIKISNTGGAASFTNVTVSGTTTLSGLTASTALALNGSKEVVSVTNTGTGNNVLSASPTLTGTISAAAATLSGNLTLSGGTANGVLYLDGSKVATSGSALTFNGSTLGVTGSATVTTASGIGYLEAYGGSSFKIRSSATMGVEAATGSSVNMVIGGSEVARFDGTGLGIGTSSPATKLQVSGTGSQEIRISTLTSGSPRLGLNAEGSNGGAITYDRATSAFVISNGGVDRATLDLSGNLGIGTSSPTEKLTVSQGNIYALRTGGAKLRLLDQNNEVSVESSPVGGGSNMIFKTSALTQMTLDASGNLGLGVTPSAWGAGTPAYQVLRSSLWGAANNAYVGANYYYDGSNRRYIGSDFATEYAQLSGQHRWYTALSGTAGDPISFGDAKMTLDASGNLLVGQTSGSDAIEVTRSGSTSTGLVLNQTGTSGRKYIISSTGTGYGSAGNLIFYDATAAAERARITSGGDLLVGTTSDYLASRVLVKTTTTDSSTNALTLQNSAATDLLRVRSDGYTYAGFYAQTTGSAANVFIGAGGDLLRSTSSLKYKTDVQNATHGLAEVMQLRPVTYKGKNDGDTVFGGLVAEEVHALGLTEFVQYAPDGSPDALAYGNMVSLLIKAIQEQQALITALTARVAALEAK